MASLSPDSLERIQTAISPRRTPGVQSVAASMAQRQWRYARSARVRDALFGEQERNRKVLDGLRAAYQAALQNQSKGVPGD